MQHVFEDFTERKDFHQVILLGVIILMDQSKKDPTKSNLMYLTIFMMLNISASRELAMNLNTPFNLSIQLDLANLQTVEGQAKDMSTIATYSDLVFVSVYGLIKNGPRLLKPIYKSIIAILSNLAPYTKTLCKEGCDGLMYLFSVFSKKDFLMEKEDNCKTLASLMESINYLIAYHDESNQYLQIQLMRYQNSFDQFDQMVSTLGVPRKVEAKQVEESNSNQTKVQEPKKEGLEVPLKKETESKSDTESYKNTQESTVHQDTIFQPQTDEI